MGDVVVPTDSKHQLVEHLSELSTRIQRILLVGILVSLVVAWFIEDMFELWLSLLPLAEGQGSLTIYSPYSWLDAKWGAVGLCALWIISPWLTMELWHFARPGLLPREKRWVSSTLGLGILLGSVLIILIWAWGFPWLVKVTAGSATAEGIGAHYDIVSLFQICVALSWFILILYLLTLSLAIAKSLGLVGEDPLESNRIRLHFVAAVAIYLFTPAAFSGLYVPGLVFMAVSAEAVSSASPFRSSPRGRNPTAVMDGQGGERRVLFADCSCAGSCPNVCESLIPSTVGMMSFESLCILPEEWDDLVERIHADRVTDIVIGGCDSSPLPYSLRHSLEGSGVNLSGLNISLTRLHSDSASDDVRRAADRIDLARTATPWSKKSQLVAVNRILAEESENIKVKTSDDGNQPWGTRLYPEEVWVSFSRDELSFDVD